MSAGPVRLTRVRALMAAAGLAVVALVVAGCASTVSGSGEFAGSATTSAPSTKATSSKSPSTSSSKSSSRSKDFPDPTATRVTSPSSTPSTSASSTRTSATPKPTGTDAALKSQLARTGENWIHAYAAADVPTFCSLSDPTSLQAVFDEKGITSCDTLTITWDTDLDLKAKLAAFAIPDPTKIIITGGTAFILSFDVTPSGLVGIDWIKQADSSWKVDASILSSS